MKTSFFSLGFLCISSFCLSQVGINTTAPTTSLDVNGTQRVRALNNATSDATYTRNVVADANGNLGYTTRSSAKPTPATYTGSMAVNAAPVTVATGVSLSEFTPVITQYRGSTSLPTYRFFDNGGNIQLDLETPDSAIVYNLVIAFIRNN
ncbi:hypothetical protein [Chryseobacterium sp. ERMR1:04]|uniref:hypothetical protein n=1 Tax=Chryseobacterium sp. ERMR1:04 TaxID=1705393 RepID=UPI0006C8AE9E|nr:hypothetical protein [Chryseobacterium sp. ERMR1:04]KPH14970.1 hypothetical protein AMQ68_06025 [Chryseobacterium sp. ERMR1:04]